MAGAAVRLGRVTDRRRVDPARRVALAVAGGGLVAFALIVVLVVPWDPAGGPLRLPDATTSSPPRRSLAPSPTAAARG